MANSENSVGEPTLAPLALSNFFCFALYSASLEMTKLYRGLLKDLGLTYPQYLVMVVLWEQNGLAVKEVGELLHLDSGTLTPLLKRLEKMGLIKRERNSEDERKVLISLTRKGDHLRKKALGIPGKVSCSLGISSKNADALQKAILNARDQIRAHRNSFDPEPIES
jgi:MarR family transcriptional regulator, organic hydroperoxide resistance regulator